MKGCSFMYARTPRISPDVMGTIFHVIPTAQHSPELASLIHKQRERGIDAKLVLVNHDPKAQGGDFMVTPEREVKSLVGASVIPVIEVTGNLGDQQTADYEAYKHFGSFFWNVMFPALERQNPVVQFYNFTMAPAAAMAPKMKAGDANIPGVVYSEIWPNGIEKQGAFRAEALHDTKLPMRQLFTALDAAHRRGSNLYTENQPAGLNAIIQLGLPGEQNFDQLTQTYLKSRYKTGALFNRNLIEHLAGQDAQVIDNLIIVTPEPPSEKGRILAELKNDPTLGRVIDTARIQIFHLSQYLDPDLPDVIAPPADRALENASNYFGVLVKILKNMTGPGEKRLAALRAMLKDRSTVILVGGGNSMRLPIKRDKSEAPLGDSNFRKITLGCLLPLIAQHGNGGKNRVVLVGCDQLFVTEGPQGAGGKLLSSHDAPLAMVMRVHHEPDEETLQMLTERGVGIERTDGYLKSGYEKTPTVEGLRELMRENDTTKIDENTMVSSMDPEILLRYLSALMKPSRQEPGRMLIDTLPFDLCRDLFFPLLKLEDTMDIAETKRLLTEKLAVEVSVMTDKGVEKKKRTIDPADLETLVNDLSAIHEDSKGILVIPVDNFFDTGNFKELDNAEGLIVEATVPIPTGSAIPAQVTRKEQKRREFGSHLRSVANLGPRGGRQNVLADIAVKNIAEPDEALPDVVNLTDQQSTIIGPDVKLAPGTVLQDHTEIVGDTEILTDVPTVFPPYIKLNNVKIRGGRIEFPDAYDPGKVPNNMPWRYLYNIDMTLPKGAVLRVPRGGALIGYSLPGSSKPEVGRVPMGVDLKKAVPLTGGYALDPVFHAYELKGLPSDQLKHPLIPGPDMSWMGIIRALDERHQVTVADDAFAAIADPKVINPLLVKARMLKRLTPETSAPADGAKAKSAVVLPGMGASAKPAAGLPGLAKPAAVGLPGLAAPTKPAAALPGMAAAAKPAAATVAAPVRNYAVTQNFREQKAALKAVLSSTDQNPSGLQLEDGQIDRLIELMAAAHAKHAKG
jgi:hypothetical protein